MKKRKKIIAFVLASTFIFGALTGCGKKKEAKSTNPKDKIVYALWSSPTGIFNPLLSDTTYDDAVISLTYNSLLKFDEKLNPQPDLAESYKISDDKLSITFKIKDGVKWNDGKTLTAEDVAFTFTSIADKDYQGARYGDVEKLVGASEYKERKADGIKGIEVIDNNTIKFTFKEVYSPALTNIGGMGIIPKHVWSEVPVSQWKEQKDLLTKPVGSGPYKVASFTEGQDVQLESFDEYFNGKPKTKKFIFKVSNEDTTQVELLDGTVDVADVSNLKKKDLEEIKSEGMNIKSYSNNMIQYMGLNLREKKFQDKNVRQAFMYALDRKSLVDKLLEGNGEVVNTPMLPSSWPYPEASKLNDYKYSVEKAKELLKKAGYEDKNNDGIVEDKEGNKLTAKLSYPTGNKLREQTAPIIQESFKQIGVQVELEGLEFSALMDKVVANHDFDLYLMGNNLAVDPDPTPYWKSSSASDEKGVSAWNISSFKNEEADKLMDEGLKVFDQKERKKIYENFAVLMNDEVPWTYLYAQNIVKASNPKLKNFNPSTFRDFSDVEKWYIEN
ncbi:ABC transporter substrate-binding protein [Clostridioides difficile]|uniref:peptide-binding protein n=1 Tax=Clostridioides difficile TaxID=1496 RepID=UPI000C9A15C7|nr:peptide-binding protein [Clostridioides difficile]MBF9870321.1 peptide-binding protein [Clostridioides difficile]MBY1215307.1 peptide-binding protein [Clostridioides difficile]MBZ1031165.1 peptide-binding protein [Clostridioides difficile]MCA0851910.1 peptide-binding protein [Clostridioides difficile]MCA0874052.1 peptide-binding protein [Clostridioides difficile]